MRLTEYRCPWTQQPQAGAGVAWADAITRNLVFLAPLSPGLMVDLASGMRVTDTGTGRVVTAKGVYAHFGAATVTVPTAQCPPGIEQTTPVTIAWTEQSIAPSGYSAVMQFRPLPVDGIHPAFVVYRQSTAGGAYAMVVGPRGASPGARFPTEHCSADGLRRYVLRCAGGVGSSARADYALWRDGRAIASVAPNPLSHYGGGEFSIGSREGGADKFEGALGNVHIWSRALTDAEAVRWSADEFCTREPQRIWVPRASAPVLPGAITLSAGALVYKPAAAPADLKLYLTAAGALVARTAPAAGERPITLGAGGAWQAGAAA